MLADVPWYVGDVLFSFLYFFPCTARTTKPHLALSARRTLSASPTVCSFPSSSSAAASAYSSSSSLWVIHTHVIVSLSAITKTTTDVHDRVRERFRRKWSTSSRKGMNGNRDATHTFHEPSHDGQYSHLILLVEEGGQLVTEENPRTLRDGACDCDALPLAAAQRAHLSVRKLSHADVRQRPQRPRGTLASDVYAAGRLLRVVAGGRRHVHCEGDIAENSRHHHLVIRVLKDNRRRAGDVNRAPDAALGARLSRSCHGRRKAREAPKERRFPGAVQADNHVHASTRYAQAHPRQQSPGFSRRILCRHGYSQTAYPHVAFSEDVLIARQWHPHILPGEPR